MPLSSSAFGPPNLRTGHRVHSAGGILVDAEADPGEQTILELAADEGVAQDRVVAVSALAEQEVRRLSRLMRSGERVYIKR